MDEFIEDFLKERPKWTRDEVILIAEHAKKEGIPFCWDCHDWHFETELHTFNEAN